MALSREAAFRKDRNADWCEFQHRHFATIADILRDMDADIETVGEWADRLARTNARFDRERFIAATGATPKEPKARPATKMATPRSISL